MNAGGKVTKSVVVVGTFDDLQSRDVRMIEEASRLGNVTTLVFDDDAVRAQTGKGPKFSLPERLYLLGALRFVARTMELHGSKLDMIEKLKAANAHVWMDSEGSSNEARLQFCREHQLDYQVVPASQLRELPEQSQEPPPKDRKKVIVTGCYDWFHSGHVRFFEEVSAYGDLYVIVGHDANIKLLKGEGHPLLPQQERRYMVASVRHVAQALISSGDGWLDADPEIRKIKPDIYAVNEDGDRGGKREYCEQRGIEYLVLKRIPAPGLPERSSTNLRGF